MHGQAARDHFNEDFNAGADFFWPLLQLTCRFYSSDGGTDEVYATSCKLLVLIRAIRRQAEEEGEGGGKGMIGVMVVVVH